MAPIGGKSGEATSPEGAVLTLLGGRGGSRPPLPKGLKSERSEAEVPEGRTTTEATPLLRESRPRSVFWGSDGGVESKKW